MPIFPVCFEITRFSLSIFLSFFCPFLLFTNLFQLVRSTHLLVKISRFWEEKKTKTNKNKFRGRHGFPPPLPPPLPHSHLYFHPFSFLLFLGGEIID